MMAGDQQGRSLILMTIGSGGWLRGALFYNDWLGLRADTLLRQFGSVFCFIHIKN